MGPLSSLGDDAAAPELFVDPSSVQRERNDFRANLKKSGRMTAGKRDFYARAVPVIGANGVLDVITELWPKCHSEAHDLGKVIFADVRDIGTALRVCRDGCYSGCMHGVLMEAFGGARDSDDPDGHVDVALVRGMMNDLCDKNETMTSSYSPGDCAHAVGHALMVLSDYVINEAVTLCDEFASKPMAYYCATGAYMEYVSERDRGDTTAGRSLFYPCDTHRYPAACARYKMVHVVGRTYRNFSSIRALASACEELSGFWRLGCFHGLGNGFMGLIATGKVAIDDLCLLPSMTHDDRFVCVEGAIERMAKYHPERAREVCANDLKGWEQEVCAHSIEQGMYNMEKDFSLYIQG